MRINTLRSPNGLEKIDAIFQKLKEVSSGSHTEVSNCIISFCKSIRTAGSQIPSCTN